MSGGDRIGTLVLSIDLGARPGTSSTTSFSGGWTKCASQLVDLTRDAEASRHLGRRRSHALRRQRIDPGCRLRARDCRLGRPGVARTGLRPRATVARAGPPIFRTPQGRHFRQHAYAPQCRAGSRSRSAHRAWRDGRLRPRRRASPLARKLGPPPIRFGLWQPPTAWKLLTSKGLVARPSGRFAMRLSGPFGSGRCCTCGWTLCG